MKNIAFVFLNKIILMGLLSFFLFVVLSACSEEIKDVDYYKSHQDEMKTKIEECAKNPGKLKDTPNCVNAKKAQHQIIFNPNASRDFHFE